ncbi:MAG: flagellar biosynthesis protein FliQ [Planctomycetota bacterium]|jgi:flagellar biosynthetic protein FliQ|nr:flagellar biosynthesis protein FliQ [Planctomycetota bacterium]
MLEDTLVHLMREMIYVGLLLLMPPVGIALVVGLLIGLLQAITSIQEQTLSFVPKIVAVALVYIFLGSWMLRILLGYTTDLFAGLPEWGAL